MRKISLFFIGAITGALIATVAAQPQVFTKARAASADTYRQLNLFGDIFEHVRAQYVEKVEDSKLIEAAINGMLSSLDPHSQFLSPKNYRDMQTQTRGEFGGLGIEVTMEDGLVKVMSPIDNTPAARGGVQPVGGALRAKGEGRGQMHRAAIFQRLRGIAEERLGEQEPGVGTHRRQVA